MSGSAFGSHVGSRDDDDEAESRAWEHRVRTELVPMLQDSALTAALISPASTGARWSVKQAVEIGASLLLGKPLILAVEPGSHVPDGLARAADRIVEIDLKGDPDGTGSKLNQAMTDVMAERGED